MTSKTRDSEQRYIFDQAWLDEQRRLVALENIWDDNTFSRLAELALPESARCLEVGAGNGSVAAWLCNRVGPTGSVVATDLDTRFLAARIEPNLEVREHDIVNGEVETAAYDLVHTRLLLSHLPGQEQALTHMLDALKPGGWLVVQEFDHVSFLPDPGSSDEAITLWGAWTAAFTHLAAARGLDLDYGRRLWGIFEQRGLVDIATNGQTYLERGGTEGRDLLRLSVLSLREHLVATGEMTHAQVDLFAKLLASPDHRWQSQIMVTAVGRKQ